MSSCVNFLQFREQWEDNNRLWQSRVKSISIGLQKQTEGVQYTVFESMQTIMDYIEETFEKIMIPPTPESEKFSEEPSFKMTLRRIVDMTYRFNVGMMNLSMKQAKAMSNPEMWANAAKPVKTLKSFRITIKISF